jgi:hypothetical protein
MSFMNVILVVTTTWKMKAFSHLYSSVAPVVNKHFSAKNEFH